MSRKNAVLVTGAASGMGAAHAMHLATLGYHVHIADLQETDALAAQIRAAGGSATPHRLDVTSSTDWDELAETLGDFESALVGLVNNAGVASRSSLVDTTDEHWRLVIDVNVTGAFYGMRALAPLLARAAMSSIVNVSSVAGMTGYRSPAYSTSKWALRGLTKDAAGEFAQWGVRVNSIHPGLIETPMIEKSSPEFVISHLRSIPFNRAGRADEVSRLVGFLISDDSSYISGSEIAIDGAFSSSGLYYRVTEEQKLLGRDAG